MVPQSLQRNATGGSTSSVRPSGHGSTAAATGRECGGSDPEPREGGGTTVSGGSASIAGAAEVARAATIASGSSTAR